MTSPKRRRFADRPLKRRVANRQPRKTILIFCEGVRTEPEYLHALGRWPTVHDLAAVDLRVATGRGGSVPMTLVSMAIDARRKAHDEESEIDEFWCVFDVEWPTKHPDLKAAVDQAHQGAIKLAISNPCFELWLILHFRDHTRSSDTDEACKARRQLDGSGNKGLDGAVYMPLFRDAARRAADLDKRNEQNGTYFPHNNPSSGMHRLIAALSPE